MTVTTAHRRAGLRVWTAGLSQVAWTPSSHLDRWPLRAAATTANGQPAVTRHLRAPRAAAFTPASLEVLTLAGDRVSEITPFAWLELFERFGVPQRLPR